MSGQGKVLTLGETIDAVREEFFRTHHVSEFVALLWNNAQSDRYGAPWAKLLAVYLGMPAERKSVDIEINTTFSPSELAAARHAQEIAGRALLDVPPVAIDGEYREQGDAVPVEDNVS